MVKLREYGVWFIDTKTNKYIARRVIAQNRRELYSNTNSFTRHSRFEVSSVRLLKILEEDLIKYKATIIFVYGVRKEIIVYAESYQDCISQVKESYKNVLRCNIEKLEG